MGQFVASFYKIYLRYGIVSCYTVVVSIENSVVV